MYLLWILYTLWNLQGVLKDVKVTITRVRYRYVIVGKYLPAWFSPSWMNCFLTEVLMNLLNLHKQSLLESLFFLFPKVASQEYMTGCPLLPRSLNKLLIHIWLWSCTRLCCKTKMKKTWCALMNLTVKIPWYGHMIGKFL